MSSLPSWLAPFADGSGVAAIIDHTLLKPETTPADIERLTAEARSFRFGAVCVNGQWVGAAARRLAERNFDSRRNAQQVLDIYRRLA